MLGRYDFVAFDFDGTLVDFVQEDGTALEATRCQLLPHVDPADLHDVAVAEIIRFHEEVDLGEQAGEDMHRIRLARTVERLAPEKLGHIEEIVQCYRQNFVDACRPLAGADAVLTSVVREGKPLAIVSNAYDAREQRDRIAQAFPDTDFAAIVIASECAAPKPHRAPFDRLLELMGQGRGRGVYVGDQPAYDISGALLAGLDAIIVSPCAARRRRARAAGAFTVTSLHELVL